MRRVILGIAAAMAVSFAIPAFALDMTEEVQEEEQPGSEIEMDLGVDGATVERKSGAPVFHPADVPMIDPGTGAQLGIPDEPDAPLAGDPVDAELPGEGPENLSGPDDDDDLPD
jgi:hypothetical protein